VTNPEKREPAQPERDDKGFFIALAIVSALLISEVFALVLVRKQATIRAARAKSAIAELYTQPTLRVKQASLMLPPEAAFRYGIEARREYMDSRVAAMVRRLSSERLRDLPEECSDPVLVRGMVDYYFAFRARPGYRNAERQFIESLGGQGEGVFGVAIEAAYQRVEEAYWTLGTRSEAIGDIPKARESYSRYVALARSLSKHSTLCLDPRIQRRLLAAEVKLRVLQPRHKFRTQALVGISLGTEDDDYVPRLDQALLLDRDTNIRSLATFASALSMYREGQFIAVESFLDGRREQWGVLAFEIRYLMGLTKLKLGSTLVGQNPGWGGRILREGERMLSHLRESLPARHYLRDDCLIAAANAYQESNVGSRAASLFNEALVREPEGDRILYVERQLHDAFTENE
jgi:tetratricopeptide (TPR) repeat protein